MKLFIILTFITLTFSNNLLRIPIFQDPHKCPIRATSFFTALFHTFELGKPNQLLKCFDLNSANLYFQHLIDLTDLVTDAEKRDAAATQADWLKLEAICKQLQPLWNCISQTQDWSNLLTALDVKECSPDLYTLANYIYLQADYGKLAEELPPIIATMKTGNYWKAGGLKGNVINATAKEIKERGLPLLALKGYWNGVHMGLGLPDAKSVYQCSDNKIAVVRLEFVYGMASAVASGSANEAADNVKKWYQESGEKLLEKLPRSYWKCWRAADDTKTESEKLGVDVTAPDYMNRVSKFVHTQSTKFWEMQKIMKDMIDHRSFIDAGIVHGHLMEAAANCK